MNTFTVTILRNDQVLSREVNKDSFTIGRSMDCDISLNDNHISRVHLVVVRRWNQIWIEDKNSSNGTYINGTKMVQGSPVNVVASDKIQLGRSDYVLSFELGLAQAHESEPIPEASGLPVAAEEFPVEAPSALNEKVAEASLVESQSSFQVERAVHEAKRKAAQIILEGEAQAEKRVQSIYQKAREAQSNAEHFYQSRVTEAHKEADAILADYQKQGQALLHEARTMAQELREEVDVYVDNLKMKARQDAENLVTEATLASEKMKSEALALGRQVGQQEADAMVRVARDEAARILDFSQLQTKEAQQKLQEHQDLISKTAADLVALQEKVLASRESLESAQKAEGEAKEKLLAEEVKAKEIQQHHESLALQKKTLESSLQSLQEKQAQLSMDVRDIEAKKNHLFKEYDAQKIFLSEKLEKEKSQMAKTEEERLEEMRVEMSKRLQKMERDLLDDVIRKKDTLVKEIHASIEKEVVTKMEAEKWRGISDVVSDRIKDAIDGKVATLAQTSATTAKPTVKKRRSEKSRWVGMGLAMGVLAYFVSQVVVDKISSDQSPMQTLVQTEAKKRQEELEKRKFNPPQAEELKETYTDAVIYTRSFPDVYTDLQFQQKLYKAASQYLLKTWRLEEHKSIEVLSAATALVKELSEQKTKIHPDFIKEGIEKMRQLETDTLARMKDSLGSEVRLESFRRFERSFFKEEVQRRRMAQH